MGEAGIDTGVDVPCRIEGEFRGEVCAKPERNDRHQAAFIADDRAMNKTEQTHMEASLVLHIDSYFHHISIVPFERTSRPDYTIVQPSIN